MNYPVSQIEINAMLREDLSSFIMRSFIELNPASEYMYNWHIDLIASKLNEVRLGKCKRLIINIPPRNMKSICASVAFPAWLLGHDPSMRIICASYGQDLSEKLALDCRNIMKTDWYQSTFPQTRISPVKGALHDFMTTQQGGRLATSVGGVITGRGAEVLIMDDPIKPDEAFSDTTRVKANDWFDGTARSRLNSKKDGAIIIIMQRLHLDDLTGHVLEKEEWDVLSLPAISDEAVTYHFDTPYGLETVTRSIGEPLHAERESLEILAQMRIMTGEYNFAGQYQQSPVPAGGGIIKTGWIQYLPEQDFPDTYDSILQSWDTASKIAEINDYSVCTTWGVKDKKIYLLNVWRKRAEFPDLKRAAIVLYNEYKATKILIEDKSSGIALIQELKEVNIYVAKAYKPECDKKMRLHQQSILFENGQIFLPEKAHWLSDYVHEVTSFPTGKHDDQVDSTTQALALIREEMDEPGIIGYYRMLLEERSRGIYN
jgi:predicted phage terminase large subunit-like protein